MWIKFKAQSPTKRGIADLLRSPAQIEYRFISDLSSELP